MEIKWFIWDGIIYPNRPFYFHGDKMAIKPIRDTHFYPLSRGGDKNYDTLMYKYIGKYIGKSII